MGGQNSKEEQLRAEEEEKALEAKREARKQAKYQKKQQAAYDAEKEKLEAQAQKKAAKSAERKAAKAEAKKLEEQAKAEAPAPAEAPAKKKKKKKKKGGGGGANAAAAAKAAEPKPEETFEEKGWKEVPIKKDQLAAKKAQGSDGPQIDAEMLVNPRHYTVIIGAQGSTRAKIEEATGVRLLLPKKGSSSEQIKLTGTEEGIAKAKSAINELIDKGYSKLLDGDLDDVQLEVGNIGLLIGPSGSTLRAIQTKTNTKINLPEKGSDGKSKNKIVSIMGESAQVLRAKEAIKQLMKDGFSDLTHDNYGKVSIAFPSAMTGILLGPKGANIKKIQEETDTKINVPGGKKDDKDGESKPTYIDITIVGPVAGIEKARAAIKTVQTSFLNVEVDFPAVLLSTFIGEKGANIRHVQTTTKTRIDVAEHLWDPSQKTITISGFEEDVKAAKAEMDKCIAQNTSTRLDFPAERVRVLVGKGGADIKELRRTTGCRIDIGDHEWDDLVKEVLIVGSVSGVADCRAQVEKLAIPPPKPEKKVAAEEAAPEDATATAES